MLSLVEPEKFSKVCFYFNKTIKNNPSDLQTINEYALYLNKNQKYKDALAITLPRYKSNSSDIKLNQQISDSYLGLNDFGNAFNYLEYLYIAQPNNFETKRQLAFAIFNSNKRDKEQLARGSAIIKDAIAINPKDAQSRLIHAYYMAAVANVSTLQKMESQYQQCKKTAREEYLLAKKLDNRIYDKIMEDFIK